MTLYKSLWSTVLILSLCVLGISIRFLALHDISFSESLIIRGLTCLLITIGLAVYDQVSIKPKKIKIQILRAVVAGLALTFFSLSYRWMKASTVAILSHIDVPLIILISPLIGEYSSKKSKYLSVISIVFLAVFTLTLEQNSFEIKGLLFLFIGVFLLSFGYLFIKKSIAEESTSVTILTPAAALAVYGVLNFMIDRDVYKDWTAISLFVCVLSGGAMYLAYISTIRLYNLTNVAEAEFPTLLSTFVIFPLEYYFLNQDFKWTHLFLCLGFTITTYYVIKTQSLNAEADSSVR